MKVVILCGGKGTRLQEETEYRPKPMVPIGKQPILLHIMKYYASFGHNEFILCLGHKGDIIKDYFRNYIWNTSDITMTLGSKKSIEFHRDETELDWKVTLADTGSDSMTACRIKKIQHYIPEGESFLLTYGDGLSTIEINKSIETHNDSEKILTISAVHPAGRFGSMQIDTNGNIHQFSEKPQYDDSLVNGGYMVCDYSLFNYLDNDPNVMFEKEPINKLLQAGELNSYVHKGFWQPMDTAKEAQYLNKLWEKGNAPWKKW